jgi:hypothetical protein
LASSISLKSMLERVWWCKCFEMESWRWTTCFLLVVEKEGSTPVLGVVENRMLLWGVVGKGRCYCQFVLRLQERKDVGWVWT